MAIEIFKKSHAIFSRDVAIFEIGHFWRFSAIFGPKLAFLRDFGVECNNFFPLTKLFQVLGFTNVSKSGDFSAILEKM